MGNREVVRDKLYGELEEGLSYTGGEIQIDDPNAVLVHDNNFCPVVTELVNNCLDKGATVVTVRIEWGRIVVEDDVVHTQKEREAIMANVGREMPRSTKEPDPEAGYPLGGVGIWATRRNLANYGGSLSHEVTEDGRIRAVASWPVEH